jgi:hypothetical protein
MKMDRRLTNGLAWAGALLVIGIPVADYLSGALSNGSAPSVAVVDAEAAPEAAKPDQTTTAGTTSAKPAAETPTAVASASNGNAVDSFIQSGKPLPSYITGEDSKPAATPAKPAATAPAATKPATTPAVAAQPAVTPTPAKPAEQVAALPPAKVAPVPMPLSMRPQPVTVPLASAQPLIVEERPALVAPAPFVPAQEPGLVTAEDLEEWESGPLNEFLARRQQGGSSVTYQVQRNEPRRQVQQNGFWLDEGPDGGGFPMGDDEVYLPF